MMFILYLLLFIIIGHIIYYYYVKNSFKEQISNIEYKPRKEPIRIKEIKNRYPAQYSADIYPSSGLKYSKNFLLYEISKHHLGFKIYLYYILWAFTLPIILMSEVDILIYFVSSVIYAKFILYKFENSCESLLFSRDTSKLYIGHYSKKDNVFSIKEEFYVGDMKAYLVESENYSITSSTRAKGFYMVLELIKGELSKKIHLPFSTHYYKKNEKDYAKNELKNKWHQIYSFISGNKLEHEKILDSLNKNH
ncbi:hypothetical protein [Vibrio nigripulchritudo]|uniref:hypothetical protein n=1 Tax=Vibrio nigripulchritudo TaxID=28173 RepID=UPI0003B21D5A|nr:hypothetical protein [Vibrio nigripulchritudo]CCN69714.1 hypothetical protein VIBNISFn118_1450010 [Vibrio nigripulchritudo SFn118]